MTPLLFIPKPQIANLSVK